jgi:hypothetical protein
MKVYLKDVYVEEALNVLDDLQAKVFFEKVFRLNLKGKTFVRVILTNVR